MILYLIPFPDLLDYYISVDIKEYDILCSSLNGTYVTQTKSFPLLTEGSNDILSPN
jgi:hypothetical protein